MLALPIIQAEELERIEESKEGIIFARKRIKELERELRRKDKALAETAIVDPIIRTVC